MRNPLPIEAPELSEIAGALLVVDVSGFSALAEKLCGQGAKGLEQLSSDLNAYFDRLIATIEDHGGDVVKLAGDALIALWETHLISSIADSVDRATFCAISIQRERSSEAGALDGLSVAVGIGAGQLRVMSVGGVKDRWEVLLTGRPLIDMGRAADLAESGDIVLAPSAANCASARTTPLADGFKRVQQTSSPEFVRRESLPVPDAAAAALVRYVPAALRARLVAGQSRWLSELRRVSVIFVNLPDWNDASTETLRHAQSVMVALQNAVYRYEGSINKLSVDDKGVTLLAVLGLPPLAHEEDPIRAIHAALLAQSTLRALRVRSAIGVATGVAFCGVIGSPARQEYTVIGTTVNRAARLMQRAPGDVLCDESTYHAASSRFRFEALGAVTLKGSSAAAQLYRPFSEAKPIQRTRSIVGRTTEREQLRQLLGALAAGRTAVVGLVGEPGIGKSRLLSAIEEAATAPFAVIKLAADSVERSAPYHAWRQFFSDRFGVESILVPAARREVVTRTLNADPRALRLAPLLNPVLTVDFPENELTAQMTGQVRADNLVDLCLRITSIDFEGPKVILFDDAHWADSGSWHLATQLARRWTPSLFVTAFRRVEMPVDYANELREMGADFISVQPLDHDETLALATERLGGSDLPAAVRDLIIEKSQGNPFFVEQLAHTLNDAGVLQSNGGMALRDVSAIVDIPVPDSVQGIITRRIDRLPPSVQLTLKVASVIGRAFAVRTLRDVYPIPGDRGLLGEYLSESERAELTCRQLEQSDLAYLFKHIITRDVAYQLMLVSQRQELHRAIALWYENTSGAVTPASFPLLAHHWRAAGDLEHARSWLERAGTEALKTGAYAEAAEFLMQVRAAFSGENARARSTRDMALRRARVERQLGQAFYSLGQLDESRRHYLAALDLLASPVPTGHVALTLSIIQKLTSQALRHVVRRVVRNDDEQSRSESLEAARSFEGMSLMEYFANNQLGTLNATLSALDLAERAGDLTPELALAYAATGLAAGFTPAARIARYYLRRASDVAQRIDDVSAGSFVELSRALFESAVGAWDVALSHLHRGLELQHEVGDRRRRIELLCLLSTVKHYQGCFLERIDIAHQVSRVSELSGDVQARAWGWLDEIETLMPLGQGEEANRLFEKVLAIVGKSNIGLAESIWAYGLLARCRADQGRWPEALDAAKRTIELFQKGSPTAVYTMEGYAGPVEALLMLAERPHDDREMSGLVDSALRGLEQFARRFPIAQPRLLRMRGRLFKWRGRRRGALSLARYSLHAATRLQMPYESALAELDIGIALDDETTIARAVGSLEQLKAKRDVQWAAQR